MYWNVQGLSPDAKIVLRHSQWEGKEELMEREKGAGRGRNCIWRVQNTDSVPHTGDPEDRELPFATVLAPCFYSCLADSTIFFAFSTEVLAQAIYSYHQFQNESPLYVYVILKSKKVLNSNFLPKFGSKTCLALKPALNWRDSMCRLYLYHLIIYFSDISVFDYGLLPPTTRVTQSILISRGSCIVSSPTR